MLHTKNIVQLQKWMVSVFPSNAAHFVHQRPGTQVETMGDALEVKLCKPILNYCIVTTKRIKSTCYHQFPVKLPYKIQLIYLKYPIVIYSTKAKKSNVITDHWLLTSRISIVYIS